MLPVIPLANSIANINGTEKLLQPPLGYNGDTLAKGVALIQKESKELGTITLSTRRTLLDIFLKNKCQLGERGV